MGRHCEALGGESGLSRRIRLRPHLSARRVGCAVKQRFLSGRSRCPLADVITPLDGGAEEAEAFADIHSDPSY